MSYPYGIERRNEELVGPMRDAEVEALRRRVAELEAELKEKNCGLLMERTEKLLANHRLVELQTRQPYAVGVAYQARREGIRDDMA